MPNALEDPLARFRTSMGASATSTEHQPPPRSSPDPEGANKSGTRLALSGSGGGSTTATSAEDDGEDGAQLLRLIDEATHAIGHDDESPGRGDMSAAGASFIVTASASQTSFALQPPPQYAPTGGPASLNASHSMLPPTSPPTFAETMANPNRGTPVLASAAVPTSGATGGIPLSPPPFGMMTASIQQHASVPPPPPPHAASGPAENMIVRNLRGVFLLQPIGKSGGGANHQGAPGTPSYAPPQYSASCPGASPPVSPLPSYALPPPLPAMQYLGGSVQGSTGGLTQQHHGTPQLKGSGQSPPYYPAPPPPYRSPAGKGST